MTNPYESPEHSFGDEFEPEFYQHTGAMPLGGMLLMLALGGVTAIVLGVVYAYAVNYIPFVYILFLLPVGFGAGLGAVVGLLARAGHVRNNGATALTAFVCGLLGLYVAWAFDWFARFPEDPDAFLLFDPNALFAYMGVFYEEGFWGLTDNTMISGPFLAAFWVAELLAICLIAVGVGASMNAGRVYCEMCRRWISAQQDAYRIAIDEIENDELAKCLNEDIRLLAQLKRANAGDEAYIQLDLASCSGCENSHYVSAQVVAHVQNNDGKTEKKTEQILGNRQILKEDVSFILEQSAQPVGTDAGQFPAEASHEPNQAD